MTGHITRYRRLLVDKQVADDALHGRLYGQIVDLPPQICDENLLAPDLELARSQLESKALIEEFRVGDRVLEGKLRIAQFVLRLFVIDHGDDATLMSLVRSALFAPRRDERNIGEVRSLALFEGLLPGLDALAFELHLALLERRFGLL